MRAGTAIRDISPKGPVQLCGYPESPVSEGVHDPLYAAVCYFEQGGERAVCLTADLCFFAPPRAAKLTAAIAGATGVPEENILLAVTHTHYGPAPDCDIYRESFGPELCPEYMDFVQAQAVAAAREAVETAFPAKLAWGAGRCGKEQGIGGNRHDPEKYAQDPEVGVLAIADDENKLRGVLVNYALHPTVLPPDLKLASADFVGYLRKEVEEACPGAVFGFLQGCSGNQSSRYFRKEQSFAEAERFGRTIGREALRVLRGLTFRDVTAPLQAKRDYFYPRNLREIPPYAEARATAQQAREAYASLLAAHAPEAECRSAECTKIGTEMMEVYARDAARYGRDAVLASSKAVELHYLVLGGAVLVSAAAEVFVEVGLRAKAASPFAVTLLSTLTGASSQSYICSRYAYEAMYYEPSESLFGCGTAEALAETLCAGLGQLRPAEA